MQEQRRKQIQRGFSSAGAANLLCREAHRCDGGECVFTTTKATGGRESNISVDALGDIGPMGVKRSTNAIADVIREHDQWVDVDVRITFRSKREPLDVAGSTVSFASGNVTQRERVDAAIGGCVRFDLVLCGALLDQEFHALGQCVEQALVPFPAISSGGSVLLPRGNHERSMHHARFGKKPDEGAHGASPCFRLCFQPIEQCRLVLSERCSVGPGGVLVRDGVRTQPEQGCCSPRRVRGSGRPASRVGGPHGWEVEVGGVGRPCDSRQGLVDACPEGCAQRRGVPRVEQHTADDRGVVGVVDLAGLVDC